MRGQDVESRGEKVNHTFSENAYAAEERERNWIPWLISVFVAADVAMFLVVMYFNNCPKCVRTSGSGDRCTARFLGRFSFQPLGENPLLGPFSSIDEW